MVDFVGTPGNDTLTGTINNDTIHGLAGNDILRGLGAVDFLYGGDGDDKLVGGMGNDLLDGGAGNDRIYADMDPTPPYPDTALDFGVGTADRIDGGDGYDILYASPANSESFDGLILIMNTTPGGITHASNGMIFQNIEEIHISGGGNARIDGGDANDVIQAGDGSHVFGRGGDDTLIGGGTGTVLSGGDGNDQIQSLGAQAQGGNGDDHIIGGTESIDRLEGDAGNDTLIGEQTDDFLYGGDGNDTLTGDIVYGEFDWQTYSSQFVGKDVLQGGAGDDVLIGGPSKDTLTGGTGADLFVYYILDSQLGAANRDVITDFSQSDGDRVDVSKYGAIFRPEQEPIPSVYTFVGTAAFTANDATFDNEGNYAHFNGEVNYHYDGANTVVVGDSNGDTVADFEIVLFGHIALTASDFVLQ